MCNRQDLPQAFCGRDLRKAEEPPPRLLGRLKALRVCGWTGPRPGQAAPRRPGTHQPTRLARDHRRRHERRQKGRSPSSLKEQLQNSQPGGSLPQFPQGSPRLCSVKPECAAPFLQRAGPRTRSRGTGSLPPAHSFCGDQAKTTPRMGLTC